MGGSAPLPAAPPPPPPPPPPAVSSTARPKPVLLFGGVRFGDCSEDCSSYPQEIGEGVSAARKLAWSADEPPPLDVVLTQAAGDPPAHGTSLDIGDIVDRVSNHSIVPICKEFHVDDLDGCTTPKKLNYLPFCGTLYTPTCDKITKPVVGMTFDNLVVAEQFYKSYAHHIGFGVRRGPQKNRDGLILWERFLCSKQGFRSEKAEINVIDEKKLDEGQKKKRKYNRKLTKCGCEAMIALKRIEDGKYKIATFVEAYTHSFASPSKQQFIRSNRQVSDKAKNALFTCHKASIGTSAAYRFLHADAGGFENIGCTKRDLQNFQQDLKCSIKSSDAQMFINNLKGRKLANPTFFYEAVMDDKGRLVHVFWADSNCRKNYSLFGDVVSFDATYSTNCYDMIFTPFTGVNHHMSCVTFGAALLANEKIEAYTWLFQSFLKAMGGVAPSLIITDEDPSMKVAIADVFKGTTHRFCMWHIMKKLSEKVGSSLSGDSHFNSCFKSCVWYSETPEEFESAWSCMVSMFGLEKNEWLAKKYSMRELWIPAFFKDIPLGGILRTTSRSESANSFFRHFVGHKLALVEFSLRFEVALETQRYQELLADHDNIDKMPQLRSSWRLEEHARDVFTHKVFSRFQDELLAAMDKCAIRKIAQEGEVVMAIIRAKSEKSREVCYDTSSMTAKCSCKFFESEGIPCRHIILVLGNEMLNELPSNLILERWTKKATGKYVYDVDGNILEEKSSNSPDPAIKKLTSEIRKKLEIGIRLAVHSMEKMECLKKVIFDGVDK